MQEALQCLSSIRGSFAFVIYDSVFHRVLAARDPDGVQPLFWGATSEFSPGLRGLCMISLRLLSLRLDNLPLRILCDIRMHGLVMGTCVLPPFL